jgi:hypothetical protein
MLKVIDGLTGRITTLNKVTQGFKALPHKLGSYTDVGSQVAIPRNMLEQSKG